MKKIRVLHYGLSDNCGGIENVVFSWFKHKPDNVIFDFVNDDKAPLAYQDDFIKGGSTIHYMELILYRFIYQSSRRRRETITTN